MRTTVGGWHQTKWISPWRLPESFSLTPFSVLQPFGTLSPELSSFPMPCSQITLYYTGFDHIIWFIIHNNHWLQFECYRRGRESTFIASVPIHQLGIYVPLIHQLMSEVGLDSASIAVDFVDQTMPQDLCGYYVLANIFYRLHDIFYLLHDNQLATGQHATLFARVRREARNTWARAGGLPTSLSLRPTSVTGISFE